MLHTVNRLKQSLFYISYSSPLCIRLYRSKTPRVRFAPSPTGYLHLGGLRTALYNYLYALSSNGHMILRIEDTDQTRKVEGSLEALMNDLDWAGIKFNEGPTIGGNFGPYIQSQRLELYRDHVNKLIENGAAYRCFCTERRLDLLRREAVRNRQIPKYDNKCRDLSLKDVENKLNEKKEYCVRFKLTDSVKSFEDLIFGGICHDVTLTEGDPVILKSDGWPTYHLANVVDDHHMDITHVLRGIEWQISTTKHIMMYHAFGWNPPIYGHLPLIVNSDGTKLSKRQSDVKVEDYRNKGIMPLALVNFITLSGGGFEHVPGSGVHLKTYQELAKEFDIEKVSSHPSRLNNDLLGECNRLELKRQITSETERKEIISKVQQLVNEKYSQHNLDLNEEHVEAILKWAVTRISDLNDLITPKYAFLWILPEQNNVDKLHSDKIELILADFDNLVPFDENNIKSYLKQFAIEKNLVFSDFMKVLRSALSGLKQGPGVSEMMAILGKQASYDRIKRAVKH